MGWMISATMPSGGTIGAPARPQYVHHAPRRPRAPPRGMWRLPHLAWLLTPPAEARQLLPGGGYTAFFVFPLLQPLPPARYACAALRHALSEWYRNEGRRPAQDGRRLKSGVYHFSAGYDRSREYRYKQDRRPGDALMYRRL
jgi:hypothetical protein